MILYRNIKCFEYQITGTYLVIMYFLLLTVIGIDVNGITDPKSIRYSENQSKEGIT